MNQRENDQNKTKKNNRGFYVALGACVIALGAAVYIGVTGTMDQLTEDKTMELSMPETSSITEQLEDVGKTESDVPMVSEAEAVSEDAQPTEEPVESVPVQVTFARPVDGEILNPYSGGELVKSKTLNEWRTHDGIDIKAVADTPVLAAADGIVEEITEDPMWGTCVTMSHENGYQTFYKGLKTTVNVTVGQQLKLGETIGCVGNTAEIEIAEDSHLHFAVKQNGEWVDPASLC